MVFFRCQNAAILFTNILGVLLTERDWNPNYSEICEWRLQWNSNFHFSGTVILQLWLFSLMPFRHFVLTVKPSEAYPYCIPLSFEECNNELVIGTLNSLIVPRIRLIGLMFRRLETNFSAC